MKALTIKAPAKINLSLDVTGRRSDGYHYVKMVMQAVSLCDEIEIEKSADIEVSTNLKFIPNDSRNLAYRAAQAFFDETKISGGAKISIVKNIPVGAGLGGGSTDAAGVIMGLNKLYGAGLSLLAMQKIGERLGADVPFFFTGGTCLAQGLGEAVTPVECALRCFAVIVKPSFSISTKWVYQNLDLNEITSRPDTDKLLAAIKSGDVPLMASLMENVLEGVTAERYALIQRIKKRLVEEGALGSLMSGSGSSVFGIFETEKAAQRCAAIAKKRYKGVFICSFL